MRTCLFFAALLLISLYSFSQAGKLDSTFDADGIVITDIGDNAGVGYGAYAVAVSPTGIIITAGESTIGLYSPHFTITEYLPDGSLNTAFGINGTTSLLIGSSSNARSVTFLPDNSILVSGFAYLEEHDFAIARLLENGIIDSSFGIDGIVTSDLANYDEDYANSMALQNDGKIVLGGTIGLGQSQDFALVRYLPNGILDSSFGANGIVFTDLDSDYDNGRDVEIQADGKILLAGTSTEPYVIIRYNIDGTLDSSFNGVGYVITSMGNDAGGRDIEVQQDGKILFVGSTYNTDELQVLRYLNDGSLDTTFGINGLSETLVNTSFSCESMALQPDGKIVLGGSGWNGTDYDFLLYRLNPDGSADSLFNSTGILWTDVGDDLCRAIALQPDNKILAAGSTSDSNNSMNEDIMVVRYYAEPCEPFDSIGTISGPSSVCGGDTVSYLLPLVNGATDYEWDIPSGSQFLSKNGNEVTIVFGSISGDVSVTFTSSCDTISTSLSISVSVSPPLALFTLLPDTNQQGFYYGYNLSTGNNLTYTWSWGDGTTSTGYLPSHIYSDSGLYNICLMILDTVSGCSDTYCLNYFIQKIDGGMHEIVFVDWAVGIPSQIITESIHLEAFPNPATKNLIIEYSLTQEDEVSIQIADITSKPLRTLFSENRSKGKHNEVLNLEGIAAGIYLLQLNTNEKVVTIKIIKQ